MAEGNSMATSHHIPVMLREVVDALAPRNNGIYIDGTFGRGGYSRSILTAANTTVYGIDRDPESISAGQKMVKEFSPRLKLLHGAFGNMAQLLANENVTAVDGIALDIGVSSPQIDEAERGFSFQNDGPLDMRMSKEGESAADIVNTRSEKVLADIIFKYGEERFSRRVAKQIIIERAKTPLTHTRQLAEIVRGVVPRSADGVDPATRTFQALRIVVNDELGELERGLRAAESLLKPKGCLAVVSFHSLEDRCVKEFMRAKSSGSTSVSRHIPTRNQSYAPTFNIITKKPLQPSVEEINANPRARSAKLRIAERTDAPASQENAA